MHQYSLEDYGLSTDVVKAEFKQYIEKYCKQLQNLCEKSNIVFDFLHRFWKSNSSRMYAKSRKQEHVRRVGLLSSVYHRSAICRNLCKILNVFHRFWRHLMADDDWLSDIRQTSTVSTAKMLQKSIQRSKASPHHAYSKLRIVKSVYSYSPTHHIRSSKVAMQHLATLYSRSSQLVLLLPVGTCYYYYGTTYYYYYYYYYYVEIRHWRAACFYLLPF